MAAEWYTGNRGTSKALLGMLHFYTVKPSGLQHYEAQFVVQQRLYSEMPHPKWNSPLLQCNVLMLKPCNASEADILAVCKIKIKKEETQQRLMDCNSKSL